MDLTIKENRIKFVDKLEKQFIKELKNIGIELCKTSVCRVDVNSIELGILADKEKLEKGWKLAFGSEVTLTPFHPRRGNEINLGTSGSFNPKNKTSYWRAIHTSSLLKNWSKVSKLVNEYCKKYSKFIDEVEKQNNL